jgi:putative oxygen-independent coproporphyrinogen III oxidase
LADRAPPLGLYVHVPWCVRKCPYCDFNSHVHKGPLPEARYVDALLTDLAGEARQVGGRTVQTVFFGGGTPSLFAAETVARLIQGIRDRIDLASDAEISLEANPGTVERGRFAGYRDAGVNRLSLGVQSFGNRQLGLLGRIHTADDVPNAVAEIQQSGIANFNLDLMYALPEQSLADAVRDVDAAIACKPPHLSHYQLTLEPGTVFHSRPPSLPDEELAEAIEQGTHAALMAAGYRRYEVSAWAQGGALCRHNLNYWQYGDYLGIGAGAHGKRTASDRIVRTERPKGPKEYLAAIDAGLPPTERAIPVEERPFEFFLNALRLVEGFNEADFEERTGVALSCIEASLAQAQERGLLEATRGGWRPTARGLRFLNDLQGLFLPVS